MRTTGRTCEVKTGESILALTAIPGLPLHVTWQPRLNMLNSLSAISLAKQCYQVVIILFRIVLKKGS